MNFPQRESLTLNGLIDQIMGYSQIIQTPFGSLCTVYADHTATGRPVRLLEDIIHQKIKPLIANSHTQISFMGSFSTQLLKYAEESLLKSFGVTADTHFAIPAGSGSTGAFERLNRILGLHNIVEKVRQEGEEEGVLTGIIVPKLHQSQDSPYPLQKHKQQQLMEGMNNSNIQRNSPQQQQGGQEQNEQQQKQTFFHQLQPNYKQDPLNPKIPVVYITPYEHHSNILPWVTAGCYVQVMDSDEYGNLKIGSLRQELEKRKHFKLQIMSVSASSNVTSQHTDLEALNQLVKEYRQEALEKNKKFLLIVDVAAYVSHNKLDISQNGLDQIDFLCISPHKLLGGSESTGVLIAKKDKYDNSNPPSFPGGGTVISVLSEDANHVWFEHDPSTRESPGTQNIIGFYRAALAFELQNWIGIDFILTREEKNAKYFYDQIQKLNFSQLANWSPPRKILFYGDPEINHRYDIFSFNIYGPGTICDMQGKSLFHPHFVSQILNDVFAIQVRSGCSCAGPYGIKLLGIKLQVAEEVVKSILDGNEDLKPGWVRLDTFFTFEQFELDYIIQALKLIAMYGEQIQRFYTSTIQGNFVLKDFNMPQFDFSLTQVINNEIQSVSIEEKPEILSKQLLAAEQIMKKPQNYLKIPDNKIYTPKKQSRKPSTGDDNDSGQSQKLHTQVDEIGSNKSNKYNSNNSSPEQNNNNEGKTYQRQLFNSEITNQNANNNNNRNIQQQLQNNQDNSIQSLANLEYQDQIKQNQIQQEQYVIQNQQKMQLQNQKKFVDSKNYYVSQPNLDNIKQFRQNQDLSQSQQFDQQQQVFTTNDLDQRFTSPRQQKNKNLIIIFEFYAKQSKMNVSQFLNFVEDFKLEQGSLDKKKLIEIYRKSSNNFKDLNFEEFLITLETLALSIYENLQQGNYKTKFDILDQFYSDNGFDNDQVVNSKMKKQYYIQNNKSQSYAQLQNADNYQTKNIKQQQQQSQPKSEQYQDIRFSRKNSSNIQDKYSILQEHHITLKNLSGKKKK